MAQAIITLTDQADTTQVHIAFSPDGTEPDSRAHHLAIRVLAVLQEIEDEQSP